MMRIIRLAAVLGTVPLLFACSGMPTAGPEITFWHNHPRSILVLPPVNRSPDIKASAAFLATSTIPLAESGYYVIPVTLSDQTFKQNGVTVADDAHAIDFRRLREIFAADAALYITISHYGASFRLTSSVVEARATARLIDLRSGEVLWYGEGFDVWESSNNSGNKNLLGMIINAAIDQIANTVRDKSYDVGRNANYRMLSASAGKSKSILYGPYHSRYVTE